MYHDIDFLSCERSVKGAYMVPALVAKGFSLFDVIRQYIEQQKPPH